MPLRMAPIRFALAIAALLSAVAAADAPRSDFTLQDFLGRTWRNEHVEFPLSEDQDRAVKAGQALVGPDGKAVLCQLVPGGTIEDPNKIAFLADLDPFETRVYRFVDAATQAPGDLVIEETAESIRIANERTGIAVRRNLGPDAGPSEAMRLHSGTWVGGSRLLGSTHPLVSYAATITARGPVFAEVVCRADFGDCRLDCETRKIHTPVRWPSKPDLCEPRDRAVRLHLEIQGTALHTDRFVPSAGERHRPSKD